MLYTIFKSVWYQKSIQRIWLLLRLIGVFPRRTFDSGKALYCLWKLSMHTISDVENLKQFSKSQFWTLFMHNCVVLCTQFNAFYRTHKAKSSADKEQSEPFNTDFKTFLIVVWKRGGGMGLPCWTPISCSCSSYRVEPTLTLKRRSGKIEKGRLPFKIKFQRSPRMPFLLHVVSYFKIKKKKKKEWGRAHY